MPRATALTWRLRRQMPPTGKIKTACSTLAKEAQVMAQIYIQLSLDWHIYVETSKLEDTMITSMAFV